jgi:hypothetical protein
MRANIANLRNHHVAGSQGENPEQNTHSVLSLKSGEIAQMMGFLGIDEEAFDQADEDCVIYELSDEALETAAGNEALRAWSMFCTGLSCPG